jgi:hypothetical protein
MVDAPEKLFLLFAQPTGTESKQIDQAGRGLLHVDNCLKIIILAGTEMYSTELT